VFLLELEQVHVYYGQIHALKGISLQVQEGEIVALLGANGAGKTTTLRTISGLLQPREGSVRLRGEPLNGLPHLARVGVDRDAEQEPALAEAPVGEER